MFRDLINQIFWRLFVNFLAIWLAVDLLSGVTLDSGRFFMVLKLTFIFSLINLIIRPLIMLISLPLLEYFGLIFILFVNTIVLYLTSWVDPNLGVLNLRSAIMAVIIISLVNQFFNFLKINSKINKDE